MTENAQWKAESDAFQNLLSVINRDGGQEASRFSSSVVAGEKAQRVVIDLMGENAKLQKMLAGVTCHPSSPVAVYAENVKLREYVQHDCSCQRNVAKTIAKAKICDCGLDDVLKPAAGSAG